jgi:hypothetical protein
MEFTLMLICNKCIKVFVDCGEKLMMLQWNKWVTLNIIITSHSNVMTCGTLLMENLHNKNITKKLHSLVGSILNSTTHISYPTAHALQVGLLTSQKCVTGYRSLSVNIQIFCSSATWLWVLYVHITEPEASPICWYKFQTACNPVYNTGWSVIVYIQTATTAETCNYHSQTATV